MATQPNQKASSARADEPRGKFQHAVEEKFEEACRRTEGVEKHYFQIAGRILQLSFAGSNLSTALTRAFEHLRVPATTAPDLHVGIWDEASSGVGAPPFLWKERGLRLRGDVLHDWPGAHLSFAVDTGTLHYFDRQAPLCACWVRSPEAIRPWERAAPLRSLLSGWAASFGAALVHGAVVGQGGKGILLTAPSGGGKSTTTLAGVARGLETLGDDFVLVEQSGDAVIAHSLYCSAKVGREMLESDATLRRTFTSDGLLDDGKRQLWLGESHPKQTPPSMHVVGLVVPEVSGGAHAQLSSISSIQVLKAMLPSSMIVVPGTGRRTYQQLLSLINRLPCSRLSLVQDHDENVEIIEHMIECALPDGAARLRPQASSALAAPELSL